MHARTSSHPISPPLPISCTFSLSLSLSTHSSFTHIKTIGAAPPLSLARFSLISMYTHHTHARTPSQSAPPLPDGGQCPANKYCPQAAVTPSPCPDNTASPAGSSTASACSAVAGYSGVAGLPATTCPTGQYCPAGSVSPTACPVFFLSLPPPTFPTHPQIENAGGLSITIDVAGVRKEDITLTRDEHHIYVTAAKAEAARDWSDVTVKRLESFSGAASRTIKVGGKFDVARLAVVADNGELRVFVPRRDGAASQAKARVAVPIT